MEGDGAREGILLVGCCLTTGSSVGGVKEDVIFFTILPISFGEVILLFNLLLIAIATSENVRGIERL